MATPPREILDEYFAKNHCFEKMVESICDKIGLLGHGYYKIKRKEKTMPLFEVAVLRKIAKDEKRDKEELLYGPVPIVAKDREAATMGAALKAQSDGIEIDTTDETLEVLVRPFV